MKAHGSLFYIDLLAPGRCGSNFDSAFFKHIFQTDNLSTYCEIGLMWVPQNPIVATAQLHVWSPGPHLNIKTVLSTYGDFHVKDKTAARTSYL